MSRVPCIPRGDAPELLEITKEILNKMTPLIHCLVVGDALLPVRFRRDHSRCPPGRKVRADPVGIKGLVARAMPESW